MQACDEYTLIISHFLWNLKNHPVNNRDHMSYVDDLKRLELLNTVTPQTTHIQITHYVQLY